MEESKELFVLGSINEVPTKHYGKLEKVMYEAKEKIPKECRIGETCFISVVIIGGDLLSTHPINLNHLHRNTKDILSLIFTLGTDVGNAKTVFTE